MKQKFIDESQACGTGLLRTLNTLFPLTRNLTDEVHVMNHKQTSHRQTTLHDQRRAGIPRAWKEITTTEDMLGKERARLIRQMILDFPSP
jgi:hypothetical protein